jgi:hypothetical protein
MAAKGGTKKKINGVGKFRGDRCTQVHKMLLREATQQTVQLHKDKKGTYDWKHIKYDIKTGLCIATTGDEGGHERTISHLKQ